MRITSKGQVTIPKKIRERPTRGQALVRRLKGRASVRMSTDEILALTRK